MLRWRCCWRWSQGPCARARALRHVAHALVLLLLLLSSSPPLRVFVLSLRLRSRLLSPLASTRLRFPEISLRARVAPPFAHAWWTRDVDVRRRRVCASLRSSFFSRSLRSSSSSSSLAYFPSVVFELFSRALFIAPSLRVLQPFARVLKPRAHLLSHPDSRVWGACDTDRRPRTRSWSSQDSRNASSNCWRRAPRWASSSRSGQVASWTLTLRYADTTASARWQLGSDARLQGLNPLPLSPHTHAPQPPHRPHPCPRPNPSPRPHPCPHPGPRPLPVPSPSPLPSTHPPPLFFRFFFFSWWTRTERCSSSAFGKTRRRTRSRRR